MQADVARVRSEHDALDRSAADLQLLIAEGPLRCKDAFERLTAYASVLSEHLLGEHDVLESAQLGLEASSEFGCMRPELQALRLDWEEYLSGWTQESASEDWDVFMEHSLVILDRIRGRIGHENDLLSAASPT